MANTPFDLDTQFLDDGYIYTNPTTGKKYVLNKRFPSYPYDTQEVDVWTPLTDVVNRTFVGPSDPTSEIDPPLPKNGDLWWDNHQLELRVWHQPKIGNAKTGELISGTGTWISSTHPMADMVTLDGNDKNHTFGNPVLFGEFGNSVFAGKYIDFEVAMPGYTGPDGPPKDTKNPPPDYIDDPDERRFGYFWEVVPQYNAPTEFIDSLQTEAEKAKYENVLVPVGREDIDETLDHYRVRVKTGEIHTDLDGDVPNPFQRTINVKCKLEVKPEFNDKFLTMKKDGEVVLHNVYAISAPQVVIGNEQAEGFIPIVPKTKSIGDIFSDSIVKAPSTYKDSVYETDGANSLVELFDIVDVIQDKLIDPDGDPTDQDNIVPGWSITRKAETGRFSVVDGADEINQVPHLVLEYELDSYNELTVNFVYGISNEDYEHHIANNPEFDPKALPPAGVTDTTPTSDLAYDFGIKFFREGFTTVDAGEMPTGQDLIDLYKDEIECPLSLAKDHPDGNSVIVRTLVISPGESFEGIAGTPSTMYFIGHDGTDFLPSFHGELRLKSTSRLEEETP